MRKRLFGILVPVILGLSLGIPSASASTVRVANPARTTHSSGVRIAATPQFLAALQKARRAGRGVRSDDPTGICWSGSSLCWRDMPTGAIDLWNRDISGDARQQWTVIYEGTANQVGCPVSGNYGVYAFRDYSGQYASAFADNGYYYVSDGTTYDYWDWSPGGGLANCADTRANPGQGPFYIPYTYWSSGDQLVTQPAAFAAAFQQIHV